MYFIEKERRKLKYAKSICIDKWTFFFFCTYKDIFTARFLVLLSIEQSSKSR